MYARFFSAWCPRRAHYQFYCRQNTSDSAANALNYANHSLGIIRFSGWFA